MLKVVHINHTDFGGAAIAAARLHLGMLQDGIDSKLLTYVKTRFDFPQHFLLNEITCSQFPIVQKIKLFAKRVLKKLSMVNDFEKEHLLNRPPGFETFTFPFSTLDITKHPLVKQADIIHLHWVARGLLNYETFFKDTNKKIVWTLHDMNPFTGGCHHADGCIGFQSNCFPCPQLKNTIDESLAGKVLQLKNNALKAFPINNLLVVTPSLWLKNLTQKSLVLNKFITEQIYNGVNSEVFNYSNKQEAREELQLPLDAKIILFTALDIANHRKGMQPLLSALANVKHQQEIILCTLGHQNLQLPNCISFGYINDENKLALVYAAADVFVLPSLAENFPNSITEALLCGTPVVAYNVGGIPEQINEQNGILVTVGSTIELANAIERILNNPESYDARQIQKEAKDKFGITKIVHQYKNLYEQLTSSAN